MDVGPVKLRPGRPPERRLVVPHAALLAPPQVIWLLIANGFRFEDLDKPVPKLSDHSEQTNHPDSLVYEQWDDRPAMVIVS